MNKIKLTKHIRHARLVKLVRRTYQDDNPGSRLFPNTSGVAWQGNAVTGADEVILKHPRPIRFGIPEPEPNGTDEDGSGGADLLGFTIKKDFGSSYFMSGYPIFSAIECKTGKSRLRKNQKHFRDFVRSINGIHYTARECPHCYEHWTPIWKGGKVIEWHPPEDCHACKGKGFLLED